MIELLHSLQGAMQSTEKTDTANRGTRFVPPRLAGRESEILRMIAENQTKAQIAEKLGVARQTLRNHLERMGAQK